MTTKPEINIENNPLIIKPYSAKSQKAKILKHFSEEGGLSTLYAREVLGIMSPAARIFELKEDGHAITTIMVKEFDANGTPHDAGRYVPLMGQLADNYIRDKQSYQLKKNMLSEVQAV